MPPQFRALQQDMEQNFRAVLQAGLANVQAGQKEQGGLLAKLHNRQSGDGRSVPFLPVLNGVGLAAPQGMPLITNVDDLTQVSHPDLATWLQHYNVALVPSTKLERRLALCSPLGVQVNIPPFNSSGEPCACSGCRRSLREACAIANCHSHWLLLTYPAAMRARRCPRTSSGS
jgi:hypothetical protein